MALRAVPGHPKFADLKAILKQPKGAVIGWLETMWHFTGQFTPQGNIGKYTDSQIEAWVEWDGEPGALIAAMVKARWIDRDTTHRLLVHDWAQHADKATKNALKRAGLDFCTPTVRTEISEEEKSVHPSRLPEPVPEPEPVPVPVPEPAPEPGAGPAPVPGPGPEPAPEPKTSPLPPTSRGVNLDPAVSQMWNFLKAQLKQALYDVPLGIAKKFAPIQANQTDYDSCFRDWWLDAMHKREGEVEFVTVATHRALSQAGLDRYGTRIEQLTRKQFGIPLGTKVSFVVRQIATLNEVA